MLFSAIYRTAELADGWHGKIISDQVLFSTLLFLIMEWRISDFLFTDVLDGAMVILAMYTMNIAHPEFLLAPPAEEKEPTESI